MFNIRPPRDLPPRYTVDGVSINEQQLEARVRARRARAAQRAAPPRPPSGAEHISSSSRPRGTHQRASRDESLDPADADVSEQEDVNITSLLERIKKFGIDNDDNPAADEIRKNRHSGNDLTIMSRVRTAVAEACGFTREKGPGNRVQYSELPLPPLDPEVDQPSLAKFTFAWSKPPGHRYNRLASFILAEQIINDEQNSELLDPDENGVLQMVAQQIRVHVRYLSGVWNNQQYEKTLRTEDDRETQQVRRAIIQQAQAADHRRRLLLDRRGYTASYYSRPNWIAILNHVGAPSMSSDDLSSDEDPSNPSALGQSVYYVTAKPWRSADLIEFLRLLDRLSDIVEKRTKFLGRPFRVRKQIPPGKSMRETARPPYPNLNREFYTVQHQEKLGKYHRYRTVAVDLAAALIDIGKVAENEGVMV